MIVLCICILIIIFILFVLSIMWINVLLNRNNEVYEIDELHRRLKIDCSCVSNDKYTPIVFQTWKSTTVIPDNMKYWRNTWSHYHPTYQHLLWDDDMNRMFIEHYFKWFLPIYDGYTHNINRADAIRYFFLYLYGGIYADMDFECLQNFDELFNKYTKTSDIILGKMNTHERDKTHGIPNAIMISKPRQEFWLCVIYYLIKNSDHSHIETSTGPIMLYQAYEYYMKTKDDSQREWLDDIINKLDDRLYPNNNKTRIVILDPDMLYPLSWSTEEQTRIESLDTKDYSLLTQNSKQKYPQAYAITYWTHTW